MQDKFALVTVFPFVNNRFNDAQWDVHDFIPKALSVILLLSLTCLKGSLVFMLSLSLPLLLKCVELVLILKAMSEHGYIF